MSGTYRRIARIVKTHGRRGEVVAVPAGDLPLMLREGLRIWVVPPRLKGPREFVVQSCDGSSGGQLVSLAGVDDLEAASGLVGRWLLARVDDLPEGFALRDVGALLGREVTDERLGDLGSITQVLRGPAQDVWVVRGAYGEVLVPAVPAIVTSLDGPDPILVQTPKGLVEGAE